VAAMSLMFLLEGCSLYSTLKIHNSKLSA